MANHSLYISLIIMMGLIIWIVGCTTSPEELAPSSITTPQLSTNTPHPLESSIYSLDFIESVNGIYIESLEEGGSQTIISVTLSNPDANTMDNAISIYAYALEPIMALPQPGPLWFSLTMIDSEQTIFYEQQAGDTRLSVRD